MQKDRGISPEKTKIILCRLRNDVILKISKYGQKNVNKRNEAWNFQQKFTDNRSFFFPPPGVHTVPKLMRMTLLESNQIFLHCENLKFLVFRDEFCSVPAVLLAFYCSCGAPYPGNIENRKNVRSIKGGGYKSLQIHGAEFDTV